MLKIYRLQYITIGRLKFSFIKWYARKKNNFFSPFTPYSASLFCYLFTYFCLFIIDQLKVWLGNNKKEKKKKKSGIHIDHLCFINDKTITKLFGVKTNCCANNNHLFFSSLWRKRGHTYLNFVEVKPSQKKKKFAVAIA